MSTFLGLFQGYGIELEYMIVGERDLSVQPITDEVMKTVTGEYVSDIEDGDISWSNELVLHVIELKTTSPYPQLAGLDEKFHHSLLKIREILKPMSARLMPTAMHPFMNPACDTKLWPHDNNEVYDAYNRIFDCRGHGWSNLQSMHINLPFNNNDEFTRLHTAIRALLPIMPALTASSPLVEGKLTGTKDSRLLFYQQNQKAIPSIAGSVIPEAVTSISDYSDKILQRIYQDIAPHDPAGILREDWLNSRGAIARFGRQTIEIRVLDTQECPRVDLAVAELICSVLKRLTMQDASTLKRLHDLETTFLKEQFDRVAVKAELAEVHPNYARAFGVDTESSDLSANGLWRFLLEESRQMLSERSLITLEALLNEGSLATRIEKALGPQPSAEKIHAVYLELCNCLDQNKPFRMNLRN